MPTHYRSNGPRFVDETIDGEALVMDMVKGSYYSCVGASAFAWNALARGMTADELTTMLVARYGVSDVDAARDVDGFVTTLLTEEMLVPGHPTDAARTPPTRATLDALVPQPEYRALALERFDDLADLILLDPVHDVTEAGWPRNAAER
ncbi:MAG TPA: PqqD family protein [Acidimicrobiia bacterium]|jgi:hypothetical protein|nr:PqqD family protein [Acidimicrobiia bacterium]